MIGYIETKKEREILGLIEWHRDKENEILNYFLQNMSTSAANLTIDRKLNAVNRLPNSSLLFQNKSHRSFVIDTRSDSKLVDTPNQIRRSPEMQKGN